MLAERGTMAGLQSEWPDLHQARRDSSGLIPAPPRTERRGGDRGWGLHAAKVSACRLPSRQWRGGSNRKVDGTQGE